MSPFVRNLLILAAVALAIFVLNQEIALVTVSGLLQLALLLALVLAGYLLWRDFGRREIMLWPRRPQFSKW